MKSPFAIFRKHQKVLMVVLTGLAMFAFIVLDSLSQNMAAAPLVLGVTFGLLIAWALARKTQLVWPWVLLGGVVGGYLGHSVQQQASASTAVVTTSLGNFTDEQLAEVHNRRSTVNQFLQQAFFTAFEGDPNPPYMLLQSSLFGNQGDPRREAVLHMILMAEARKLGLDVTRDQMTAYIDRVTNNKLPRRGFAQILTRMNLSGSDLFELLREQMIADEAARLLVPTYVSSPENYWAAYQMVNLRQELTTVPISAEAFVSQLSEPSDAELQTLFNEYKDKYPGEAEEGAPGFRQTGRVQVAYLEFDYDTIQKTLPAVTDAEIEQYYNANKDQFRNNVTPEFPMNLPDGETPEGADSSVPGGPALMLPGLDLSTEPPAAPDATAPESTTPESPAPATPPASETPAAPETAPAGEVPANTPAAPAAPTETPATENTPAAPESTESESPAPTEESSPSEAPEPAAPATETQSGIVPVQPLGNAFASVQDEQPPTEPATPAAETPAQEPAATETPAAPAEPATETPAPNAAPAPATPDAPDASENATPGEEPAATQPPAPAEPLPEFKPLDDTLKEQIRLQIQDQRTQAKLVQMSQTARGELLSLFARYFSGSEKERPALAAEIQKEVQSYAKKHGLRYVETPFLSPDEFEESEDHPLGRATEPVSNAFERASARTASDQHFGVADLQALERLRYNLFDAEDSSTLNRFLHWQIGFQKPHVPTWEEPGIREQVLRAWQQRESRKLAEKRAEEIAQLLKQTDKPWNEALEGQTETGKEGSLTLPVTYTGPFSWLSRSSAVQANPFAPPQMEVTQIPLILGGTNDRFMKTVFNEIGPDEVGTVWSADRSYIYVVRPQNRSELANVRTDFLGPRTDPSSPGSMYSMISRADGQQVVSNWARGLYDRYQVQWKSTEE